MFRFALGFEWEGTLLLGCGLLFCGCRQPGSPTAVSSAPLPDATPVSGPLVIVTPHRREIQVEFERAFKVQHPKVVFQWKAQEGTGDALNYIQKKFAAPSTSHAPNAPTGGTATAGTPAAGCKQGATSSGADIFFGGGPEAFLELEGKGLLEALPSDYGVPPELSGVPLRSYTNRWVAAALSRFGILYNKTLVERDHLPLPATWADLGNPALRGKLELVDPRRSGTARVVYESILQFYGWKRGWEVLTAMAGNTPAFVTSSGTPLTDVEQGRAVFAPSVNFLAQSTLEDARKPKAPFQLDYIEPKAQQIITPDPIGILKGAPHGALAREFVEFVMSPQGQNLWMLRKGSPGGPQLANLYRLSVLPSLYQPISPDSLIRLDPYSQFKLQPYDSLKAASRHKVLEDLIGLLFIENHASLAAQWKRDPDAARITFVPVTERQFESLAMQWDNPVLRTSTMLQWRLALARHYGKE